MHSTLPPWLTQLAPKLRASIAPSLHRSSRPPLPECSEAAFMSDLIAFLTERQVGAGALGASVAYAAVPWQAAVASDMQAQASSDAQPMRSRCGQWSAAARALSRRAARSTRAPSRRPSSTAPSWTCSTCTSEEGCCKLRVGRCSCRAVDCTPGRGCKGSSAARICPQVLTAWLLAVVTLGLQWQLL